jgi:hypothetical protein
LNTNDQASNISDKTQTYQYRSETILTLNRASIDQNAQAIHHRTTLQAIHQKIKDTIKLFHENHIFDSSFLCNRAINKGIKSTAKIIIQK